MVILSGAIFCGIKTLKINITQGYIKTFVWQITSILDPTFYRIDPGSRSAVYLHPPGMDRGLFGHWTLFLGPHEKSYILPELGSLFFYLLQIQGKMI